MKKSLSDYLLELIEKEKKQHENFLRAKNILIETKKEIRKIKKLMEPPVN